MYLQDAETVERLNESGELRQLLRPYKVSGGHSSADLRIFNPVSLSLSFSPLVHCHGLHLPDVRRLPAAALLLVQWLQEVCASESLHRRVCCAQVHELRRGGPGQVPQLLGQQQRQQERQPKLSKFNLFTRVPICCVSRAIRPNPLTTTKHRLLLLILLLFFLCILYV